MNTKLYKIESGMKIPLVMLNTKPTQASAVSLTLTKLEKGQSFLVKDALEAMRAAKIVRGAVARERERHGSRSYTTRKAGEGIRIWRVK